MSDLCSSNCGCERDSSYNCGCDRDNRSGMSSCFWIIILLLFCNGGCGNSWGMGRNNDGCDSCIWIILLLFFCGGNTFGFNNGCGCDRY